MGLLIGFMIFSGSALMVYNIIRYIGFVKRSTGLEKESSRSPLLIVPLLLLVFFLIGYIVVGFSGIADLMMASILLGGSIFVFLLLTVMFSIIQHIQDTDDLLSLRYEEMHSQVKALTQDALGVVLVNLTRDEVEDRGGGDLYDSDLTARTYTEFFQTRAQNIRNPGYKGPEESPFRREALLQQYQEGHSTVREVVLIRRQSGESFYVSFEASLSQLPVSGDVVAMITERLYNEEAVKTVLLERVLMDQYDRIGYLIEGHYRNIISNLGKKERLLLPTDQEDSYEALYYDFILPTMAWDREAGPNPLRLSIVEKALAEKDVYEVNAPFVIDGEKRYKRVVFYVVDRTAKFYVMLISDSTSLQEEQLEQNRKLSEALADAVRQGQARVKFFTRVSHDLRTPMNAILGFSSLAKTETDPARVREYLDQVDWSGKKLVNLVDDLFAMSLIDSGSLQIDQNEADLRTLAGDLETKFSVKRPDKSVSLTVDTGGLTHPLVVCDLPRLDTVLSRLLENACAFAPDGGVVTLKLSQEESPEPGMVTCLFSVSNPGEHMSPEIVEHLFETDTWEQSEMTSKLPGVGLGMAVVKTFVDRMGGTISIRSDEDGRTEFLIRMDLIAVPMDEEEAAPAGDGPDRELHILVVDDNAVNREIAELMLTCEGWTVEQAADGAEAVEKLAGSAPGTFDLILMDVQMPVMNGYQATAAIRALPDKALASTPILAVTAIAYQKDANEALEAGMDGYVTKPIDLDVIRREAARVLNKGGRSGE